MPVPVAEEQQVIEDTSFNEDMEYSPTALREWFTTNKVQRAIAHLFGLAANIAVRLRCAQGGILYVTETETPVAEHVTLTATSATAALQTTPVPSRWRLRVDRVVALNTSSAGSNITLRATDGSTVIILDYLENAAEDECLVVRGPIYLPEGWYIRADFTGVTVDDVLYLDLLGGKIRVR